MTENGVSKMLKNWKPEEIPQKEEVRERLDRARAKLYELQMQIKEHKLPVLVLFEGWGPPVREAPSERLLKILIPDFLKWQPCPLRRRRSFADHFCIVI